jgi:hypothetical protein
MKRQWRIHRQLTMHPEGARRWDQAYQLLLRWTTMNEPRQVIEPERCDVEKQEVYHEHCRIRAGIDPASSPSADH